MTTYQIIPAFCTKCNESKQHSITEHGPRCNACGYMGGDDRAYTARRINEPDFTWVMVRNAEPFPIIAKFRGRNDAFEAVELFNQKVEG